MSQKSNAVRRLGCRRVRSLLQERHDRDEAAGPGAAAEAAAAACEAHLRGCPACRRFQEFLAGYGRELAVCLDALYAARPEEPVRKARQAEQARRPAARWAVAAAAALVMIASGTQLPRLAARALVACRIRREVTALVQAVYSRPLAQGVETAMAGESLLEGLDEGDGLQGLGEGEDFLAQ
jgi:predicted anti-sigma-YlaC factor YlaD